MVWEDGGGDPASYPMSTHKYHNVSIDEPFGGFYACEARVCLSFIFGIHSHPGGSELSAPFRTTIRGYLPPG